MRRRGIRELLIAAVVACAACAPARAASPEAVDAAIANATKFLLDDPNFKKFGNWEDEQAPADAKFRGPIGGDQWGGRTAICMYALLASGANPSDPAFARAIELLRDDRQLIRGYYALGLRQQVWLYLPRSADNLAAARRGFLALWKGVKKDMAQRNGGLFDYTISESEAIDLSVSQYGVLGMWAALRLNLEWPNDKALAIKLDFWQMTDARWRLLQDNATGGWAYGRGPLTAVSPSMTAAGVATLLITQEFRPRPSPTTCPTNVGDSKVERGLAFLIKSLPDVFAGQGRWPLYTLYGVERVGMASGFKFLGEHDWYVEGSDFLLGNQARDGSWESDDDAQVSTAFALLFLSRGRDAVFANKIRYDSLPKSSVVLANVADHFWDQRPRDIANIAAFAGKELERSLNWQIIDLGVSKVDDLHDAPIAYFSGSQALKLPADQVAKLKQYVEEGGTLVFNTDCGRREFGASAMELVKAMFPNAELRSLSANSPILNNEQFKAAKWTTPPNVKAASNGVREIALFLDDDPAKTWQANEYATKTQDFALMADIYQYAIDKSHARVKGRSHIVRIDSTITPDKPAIKVARLIINGANTDPEPGGWRRLQAIFKNNTLKTPLVVTNVNPEVDDLAGYHVAHLTGVGSLQLSPTVVARLKKFVSDGGLLVIDAAGGDPKFANSIGGQLHNIVNTATADGGSLLPMSDPLFNIETGTPLNIEYRLFRPAVGDAAHLPSLHATKVGDHYGIIFSADDLSAGLVGNEIDGIRGYSPETATGLMSRILLSAIGAKTGGAPPKPPAGASTSIFSPATRPTR